MLGTSCGLTSVPCLAIQVISRFLLEHSMLLGTYCQVINATHTCVCIPVQYS